MTPDRTRLHGLEVATELFRFIDDRVLPGTGVDSARFWKGFDAIVKDLAPKNAALLAASIIALSDDKIRQSLQKFRQKQTDNVLAAKLPR